jgi:Holliday junction resolvase
MGKASRDKGKRGEREAAALLREFGFSAARAQQFKGSVGSADIACPELEALGLHLEVKNQERCALPTWIDQANADAGPTKDPLILWKRPRDGWYAILPAEVLLGLLKKKSQ